MVGLLADFDRQVQSHKACVVQPGSILDSGSSRHIHPRVKILYANEKIGLIWADTPTSSASLNPHLVKQAP